MTYTKVFYSFLKTILVLFLLLEGAFLSTNQLQGNEIIEEIHSNLTQVLPSDWEIIPIGANSYKIIIGKKALNELAQLAEEKWEEVKEQAKKLPAPTVAPFVQRISEGLKELPDYNGTITGSIKVVILAPEELDKYFSEIKQIAKEGHLHLAKSANSANWILETGYSTLPDKETAISVIEKANDAIKENKDLARYIKQNIPEGWDFSKIDVQKVVIVLHFRS